MVNKNPETDTGVQAEGQKQNSQPLALTSTSIQNGDIASRNPQNETVWELSPPDLYTKSGIKGVHYYRLDSMAN